MSMFHELMMRKKEEIMYATIKGSLTESPEGVFSGFSASNYLQLQEQFKPQDKSWKIRTTFTTGNDVTTAKVLFMLNAGTGNYGGVLFGIFNNHFWFNISSTGTSWNIQLAGQSSNTIETNTTYTVEFGFTGAEYYIDNIENGIATRVFTLSSPYYIYQNGNSNIGLRLNDGNNWNGSIDLNNSYIKLGSTKYNLQAVVGWTKVGSPTITDGVVSGFSSANYLRTSQNVNILSTANSWEIQTAFSVSDLTNSPQMIMGNAYGTSNGILFAVFKDTDNTYTLRLYTYNNGALFTALPTTKFNTLTKYYARIVFTGQQYKLLVSNDKINWNEIYSNNIDTNIGISNQYLFFGVDTRGNWSAFTGGQLYISETIIYQNHKLWFNGQQS